MSNWWDKALNNPEPPAPTPPPAQPPQYQPQHQPQAPTHQVTPAPGAERDKNLSTALYNEANYRNVNTQSRKHGDISACPNCGSANYFSRVSGAVKPRPHCFDCGWPVTQGPGNL